MLYRLLWISAPHNAFIHIKVFLLYFLPLREKLWDVHTQSDFLPVSTSRPFAHLEKDRVVFEMGVLQSDWLETVLTIGWSTLRSWSAVELVPPI